MEFNNKVARVTGGSSGIGLLFAQYFVKENVVHCFCVNKKDLGSALIVCCQDILEVICLFVQLYSLFDDLFSTVFRLFRYMGWCGCARI